jgi:adenosylcobinamide-GDP ribazoletransferase
MKEAGRPVAAAVTFLTILPVGRAVRIEARDIALGAWLFPVVGGAVGALSGFVADTLAGPLPPLAAGVLAVGVAALVTGGMHLDALADTTDALGGRTRERALEIMRDHAIGAFGATALVLVVGLDAVLLGALGPEDDALLVGLAAGAASRAAMVVPGVFVPHARPDAGQSRVLEGAGVSSAGAAVVLAVLLALPAGRAGVAAFGAAALVTAGLSLFAWRRFGGVTGDVLGATGALAQTAALVAATVVAV